MRSTLRRVTLPLASLLCLAAGTVNASAAAPSAEDVFLSPPPSARPAVMWMWMGSNITPAGITNDLEKLRDAGFGGTLVFSLADVCSPWARDIANAPTPEVVAFTPPWWKLVRHAAAESLRLGLDFGMGNCAGYESSGGPWITPENSMQEVVWSETRVTGGSSFSAELPLPAPDPRANQMFPVWNPENGKLEKPEVPARRAFFRDIAVLALPATGPVASDQIVDLSARVSADGLLQWSVPSSDWIIYRFGHTTKGKLIQPAQWKAIGLECDKLDRSAVELHLDHIIGEARTHLGDLVGTGFKFFHFDSYEAGTPGWTPRMREEFRARRGYDPVPFLPTLAKRIVGDEARSDAYRADFARTIADLFRENYYPVIERKLRDAGIEYSCEPYGGPWKISEITPHIDRLMAEFWTHGDKARLTGHLVETVRVGLETGFNPISAEAFTGRPANSQWSETPASLKSIGDAAFALGVNRFVLHRFTHQPWGDLYKPGVMMGQWGTHFDHTQTWWEPGKAWVAYLTRCQALLQWGKPVLTPKSAATFTVTSGQPVLRTLRRSEGKTDVFFLANIAASPGTVTARFPLDDRRPELWHPVTGEMRPLPGYKVGEGFIETPLNFEDSESCFIIFRPTNSALSASSVAANFPVLRPDLSLADARWTVAFDPKWGGPTTTTFTVLTDWKDHPDAGIKYYSGTATYSTTFTAPADLADAAKIRAARVWLDLGVVNDLARVRLNGRDLGVVWTAPWRVEVTDDLRAGENRLEIAITNTWANRLIGDEQQPADCEWSKGDQGFGGPLKAYPDWILRASPRPSSGRYTFTTWNYFTASSPLRSSGLLGPVTLLSAPAP
jgi:hypothetical protein